MKFSFIKIFILCFLVPVGLFAQEVSTMPECYGTDVFWSWAILHFAGCVFCIGSYVFVFMLVQWRQFFRV